MPVIDSIAPDYQDDVTFLAIAGRASLDATTARAADLLPSGQVQWALDESVWEAYEVLGQPVTFVISHDGVIVDNWYGLRTESDIRSVLDELAGTTS